MKKFSFIFGLFLLMSINIFGLDFSAGGGVLAGYNFTRYTLEGGDTKSSQSMDRFNYAGFLFFDAKYVEFSVLIQGGNNSYKENMFLSESSLTDDKGTGYETFLVFSLLGKYPFNINERVSLFPLFGVDYQIALIERRTPDGGLEYNRSKGQGISAADVDKNGNNYPLHSWNAFWINVGGGLDFNFAGPFFLRSELIFGFRLPTGYELGALEVFKKQFDVSNPKLAGLTGGPSFKVGVGYRF